MINAWDDELIESLVWTEERFPGKEMSEVDIHISCVVSWHHNPGDSFK